jgi:hypothetical protein
MTSKLTNFAAIFLLALVAGVFWGTWFTLTRSIDTFSAAEFIHIGKTIIANVAWPMRILMPACILFCASIGLALSGKEVAGILLQHGGMPSHYRCADDYSPG